MIKKFISYYEPHKKLFILDIMCALTIASIDLIYPMVTRSILNDIIPMGKIKTLYILGGALLGLYIIRTICNYIVDYWGHVVGARMQHDMRRDLFSHIQTLPISYFDKNKTGHIMSKLINDLFAISELAHHGPEDLLLSFVMFVGSFIILLNVDLRLTLITFIFVPIILWFGITRRKKIAKANKDLREKIADVNAQIENSISGIRVTKSFANEIFETNKFNEGNKRFREANEHIFKTSAELGTGIQFISNLLNLIVICVGGLFVYNGAIEYGDLVAYLLYINLFFQPIRRLVQFTQMYESGMAGFERFISVLNIHPEIDENKDAIELNNLSGNIKFNNVSFKYNENETILKGINLNVKPGKTLALIGPSGGGKTTLCHLIPRFYDVEEGEILIDNKNIKDIKIKSLRENIGLVSQNVFLFTGTIKENILYGNPYANDKQIEKAAKKANIHDFIMSLPMGYNTFVGEKGIRLSGGQKQRISIARVFLKNPPILILDEATSSLDNETEIKIQKSLEELSEGKTTIVIAHRLSTIKNADEIIVITDNGIKERGNHKELINRNGIYSRLFSAQFEDYINNKIA